MNNPFSWKSVFEGYTLKNLCNDSIPSVIISILVLILSFFTKDSNFLYDYVCKITDIAITIIPVMISFVLAAYVLIQTFISSRDISRDYNTLKGRGLLKSVNSSFAYCIVASMVALIIVVFIASVVHLNIDNDAAKCINRITIFFLIYIIVFSIYSVKGVIMDIYSFGQVSLLKMAESKEFYFVKVDDEDSFIVCSNWNYGDDKKVIITIKSSTPSIYNVADEDIKDLNILPTDIIPHPVGYKPLHFNHLLYSKVKIVMDRITQ